MGFEMYLSFFISNMAILGIHVKFQGMIHYVFVSCVFLMNDLHIIKTAHIPFSFHCFLPKVARSTLQTGHVTL